MSALPHIAVFKTRRNLADGWLAPAGHRPDLPNRMAPQFLGNDIYRRSSYGGLHPLAIPRVSTAIDLARALGWIDRRSYREVRPASPAALSRFHDPDYLAALQQAERDQALPAALQERFRIGRDANPIFPEVFRRPATACGASLKAAALVAAGGMVFSPAGGTHHGRPDRAAGFCYLNDPALAILALLDAGIHPVFYLDIDAHHGDGVQDAFAGEARVWTVSLHEAGRWPHRPPAPAGGLADRGGGQARNLPLPAGFHDDEMDFLLEAAVLPLIERVRPAALVLQAGADGLADDPMSGLMLSNGGYWQVLRRVKDLAPRLIVLGGGGYNPWSVARAWVGCWGILTGREPPDRLPPAAEALLRAISWRHSRAKHPPERWFTSLTDPPSRGPVRDEIRAIAREVLRP
jgi:acetoin utilization protein AcuC